MEEIFTRYRIMRFPREVIAGHGVITNIGKLCNEFKLGKNSLLITGKKTRKVAGEKVSELLQKEGYNVNILETGDATFENVSIAEKFATEMKADFVCGVGGGNKIDIGKMVCAKLKLPFISVPTSASHDGIASPRAAIKNAKNSLSVDATVPLGIIADTEIIVKAPYRLLASGCADVIANFTAVKDWELAVRLRNEEFSRTASTLARYTANVIMENVKSIKPNLEESVWIVIRPLILSGITMAIAGTTRPASGSEHMFSHALEKISPGKGLHGEKCGIGCIMMAYLHGEDWQKIKNSLQTIGAPTTSKEIGVSEKEIIKALTIAHTIRPERYTILGDKGISQDAAEKVAKITGVI